MIASSSIIFLQVFAIPPGDNSLHTFRADPRSTFPLAEVLECDAPRVVGTVEASMKN